VSPAGRRNPQSFFIDEPKAKTSALFAKYWAPLHNPATDTVALLDYLNNLASKNFGSMIKQPRRRRWRQQCASAKDPRPNDHTRPLQGLPSVARVGWIKG
jgi:hypothetical protein